MLATRILLYFSNFFFLFCLLVCSKIAGIEFRTQQLVFWSLMYVHLGTFILHKLYVYIFMCCTVMIRNINAKKIRSQSLYFIFYCSYVHKLLLYYVLTQYTYVFRVRFRLRSVRMSTWNSKSIRIFSTQQKLR